MKKRLSILITIIILLLPFYVKASETETEVVKYYKTTVLKNPLQSLNNNHLYVSDTIEVTEEEYNNSDNLIPRTVTVETTYKKLSVSIIKYGSAFYEYKAVLNWKQIPSTRSYDILGIGYYPSVKVAGNADFEEYYCLSGGSCFTNTSYYQKITSGGTGVVFALPSGSLSSLKQTLILIVEKTNSSSTITSQKAVGDYAHATSTISYSNAKNFTVDVFGIDVGSNINYYDDMPYAAATWTGTW